jgi:hypothetical protein
LEEIERTMSNFPDKQKVMALLSAALECSFYVAPEAPGLTHEELFEAGNRLGLQRGEMFDALHEVADVFAGSSDRLLPSRSRNGHIAGLQYFYYDETPEYRNIRAFDAVYSEWRNAARAFGAGQVQFERSVLVERATNAGISRLDTNIAISILVFFGILRENNGVLRPESNQANIILPSEQVKRNGVFEKKSKPLRRDAYPIVQDIISRRQDGRPLAVEPLAAFAEKLTELGYAPFRLWWMQIVSEFKQASRQTSPVVVTVLAAALVEGALTFVVEHARSLALPVFKTNDFNGEPYTWKLEKLVGSAASGGTAAILDHPTKMRAEGLIRTRQRIHAGRMVTDFPTGPIDLRPEEARDAETTAELVIGRVLEWLRLNPRQKVEATSHVLE